MNTECKSVKVLHDIPMNDGVTFSKGDVCEIRSIRKSLVTGEISSLLVKRFPHEESYLVNVGTVEFLSPERETKVMLHSDSEEPEETEETEIFQFHFTRHPGNRIYLLIDDVAEFIRDIGSTENTDVRNRLEQAAGNILKLKEGDPTC